MDMEKQIFNYLEGKLNDKLKEEFLKKISENKEAKKLFYDLKLIWETGEYIQQEKNAKTQEEWGKISTKLAPQFKQSRAVVKHKNLLKYAAMLIVAVGLTFGLSKQFIFSEKSISQNEVYVPKGQKSQLTLSDGTKIWLNSESKITYPTKFSMGSDRNVYLEGEAYFKVTKNCKVPFIVNTDKINIKVLGTSFNVKSYTADKTIETTLIEGKVSIQKKSYNQTAKSWDLNPNQKAIFNKATHSLLVEDLNVKPEVAESNAKDITPGCYTNSQAVTSWKEEILIFDNESLAEITTKLERWYGYNIEVKDAELLENRYKGKFENLESVNQVLDVISVTTPIRYTINGRNIIIEQRQ